MAVYEVLCDGVPEARVFRFELYTDALREAERVCRKYHVAVRVVQVLGIFMIDVKWHSNGVPGHE